MRMMRSSPWVLHESLATPSAPPLLVVLRHVLRVRGCAAWSWQRKAVGYTRRVQRSIISACVPAVSGELPGISVLVLRNIYVGFFSAARACHLALWLSNRQHEHANRLAGGRRGHIGRRHERYKSVKSTDTSPAIRPPAVPAVFGKNIPV